jgi:hypothetical protein
MLRAELVKRSPLRILERSTHGGLGKGNLGVVAGVKGVGKTACLVHLATDQLLQGKHVIHLSFASDPTHIVAWYENIFQELARRHNLDGAMEVHDSIIGNRIIMNFAQSEVPWSRIEKSVRAILQDARFTADVVVVDGYRFGPQAVEQLRSFRQLAEGIGLEVWFSASLPPGSQAVQPAGVPPLLQPVWGELAVAVVLVDKGSYIHLELVKDHDNPVTGDVHLKLDPRILLIAEEE